jgi:hypothetical protein
VGNSTAVNSAQRSTFVTVLAWLVILMAGFTTFIGLVQNIMISTMMPMDQMPLPSGQAAEQIPGFMRFMLANVRWFFLAFLIVSAVALASAIGLLRRKEWARLVFIALLALGIAWNVAGIFIQHSVLGSTAVVPPNAPPEFREQFERTASMMLIVSVVFALAFSALFGWLIKRLSSAPIRAEFSGAP